MVYIWLGMAIFGELVATSLLRINATNESTQPLLLMTIVLFYVISFYSLGRTMITLPTGVVYAV